MAEVKSSTITLDDKTALDPGFLLQQCQRLELDVSWYGKANSYVLPRGKRPGIGYVLLLNEDYTALTANYATTRTLKFTFGAETITLANQLIVGGTPIAQGSEINDQTAILVKVADTARWTSSRIAPGISQGANATFNMPYPHDPENNINVDTSDNAATYTNVAEGLAADAGFVALVSSAAEFPSTGTPLHWSTADRSAWDALHQFLSMYGYTTLVSRGGTRSIIPLGEDDAVAEGTLETYSSQRTRGGLGQDRTEARIPAKLSIIVPAYDYQYDDESVGLLVCPSDYHYVHHAYHIKDVLASAALAGVQAYGTTEQLPVWGDRVANFTNDARDTDPKNLVDLGTYADDLGQQLYNVLYYSMRPRDELYWGLIPIDPGPDIEAVAWFDLGDGKGMQTRVYQNLSHDTHPQGLTSTESQIPHWTDPLPRSVGERENFPISGRYSGPTFTPLIAQIEDTSGGEATKISVSKDGTAGTYRKFDGQISSGGAFTWNSDTVSPTSTLKHRDMTGIPFGTLLAPTYEVNRVLSLKNFQTNEWNHLPIQRHVYLGVVTQSGGIAARSGNTMTAGTVDVYKSVTGTWTSVAAATATVYNGLSKVVAQNSKVLIIKELLGASAEFVIVNDFDAEANFWEFTLNEDMGGGTAAADKITIGGADTGVDIEVADPAGLFTRALDGAKGVCVEIEGSYYVLECQSKAGWIKFLLKGALTSGSALATPTDFGGSQQDVQDPGSEVTVHDGAGLFKSAAEDCIGLAIYDAVDNQYVVVECQTLAGWVQFTLTEDMSNTDENQSNDAEVDDYGGSQQDIFTPGETVDIHDGTELFTSAKEGCVGLAFYDVRDGQYIAVECETIAGWIEFTLTTDLGEAPVGVALCTVDEFGGSQQDIFDPGDLGEAVYDAQRLFLAAVEGCKGRAEYDAIENRYNVVECQTKAGWIDFTLTADLTSSRSASAEVDNYGGTQNDTFLPADPTTVHDPQAQFMMGKIGCKGRAIYDSREDQYNVFECQTKAGWIHFELTADMSGGSAACTVGESDFGGSQNDLEDPGRTTIVYDYDGNFPLALEGAMGVAFLNAEDERYYIVSCDQQCLRLKGLAVGAVTSGNTTFSMDTLSVGSPVPFGQLPSGYVNATTTQTVTNRYLFNIDDDGKCQAYWDGTVWICDQAICP